MIFEIREQGTNYINEPQGLWHRIPVNNLLGLFGIMRDTYGGELHSARRHRLQQRRQIVKGTSLELLIIHYPNKCRN
jgi:hypothetical protein